MNVFRIKCAGIVIEIRCVSDGIKDRCARYIGDFSEPDIIVTPESRHIRTAEKFMPRENREEIEFAAVFCALHEKLLERTACVFHAAVVSVDGEGYAFAAQSGVGKTTHVELWKKKFGNRCKVVNGDKPIITFKDGRAYASGSPWCGKEGYSENVSVPLKGICFLERAETPSIKKLSDDEVIDRLFYQFSLPKPSTGLMAKGLEIANMLIGSADFYLLRCDISDEAAELAYKEMSK